MNLIEAFLNGNVENNIDTITSDDRIFLREINLHALE